MVTIKDIAEAAGVSRGTVDRVLHKRGRVAKDKEKQILEIANQMGYEPNIAAKGLAARKKRIKLGFLYVDDDFAPLQRIIAEEASEYAKELTPYGVEVFFIPFCGKKPENERLEDSIWEILKNYELDGCAVLGPLGQNIETVLKKHEKPSIPMVLYNVQSECESGICFVGCDFEIAGKLACGLAALMTNDQGGICIVSIDYKDIMSSIMRISGFETEICKYPKMKILEKFEVEAPDNFDLFMNRFEEYLKKNPDVDIIYFIYAGDDTCSSKMAELGEKYHIRIITSDLVTEKQKELLKNNKFSAMISQEPGEQGRKALEILFNYVALGKEPEKKWYETGLSIKIGQNIVF